MKIQKFVNKNNIKLEESVLNICLGGIIEMEKGIDVVHNHKHVENILSNLDFLISGKDSLKEKINFEILLMAICWHDVWISKRKPKNVLQLIINQVVEGYYSALMFRKYANSENLNTDLINKTFYVIRKHSSFQVIPPLSLEAKILIDLDKIELWNNLRFFKVKEKQFVNQKEFYQKYVVRFYYYYSYKMGLYIKKLEKSFNKNTKKFWNEIGLGK